MSEADSGVDSVTVLHLRVLSLLFGADLAVLPLKLLRILRLWFLPVQAQSGRRTRRYTVAASLLEELLLPTTFECGGGLGWLSRSSSCLQGWGWYLAACCLQGRLLAPSGPPQYALYHPFGLSA